LESSRCDSCKYLKKEYIPEIHEYIFFCENISLPKRYRQAVFYSTTKDYKGYEKII